MTRSDILAAAHHCITQDRQDQYGDAEDSFGLIAAYWSAHLDAHVSAHDVAVMMVLLKLARARANPAHADSYVDAAGYSAIAGEIAVREDRA